MQQHTINPALFYADSMPNNFSLGRNIDYLCNPYYSYQFGMLLMMKKPLYDYFYSRRALDIHKASIEFEKTLKKCLHSVESLFKYSEYEEFLDAGDFGAMHPIASISDKRFLHKMTSFNLAIQK